MSLNMLIILLFASWARVEQGLGPTWSIASAATDCR